MAVLVPMPKAIVNAAVSAKIGLLLKVRPANARSRKVIVAPDESAIARKEYHQRCLQSDSSFSRQLSKKRGSGRSRTNASDVIYSIGQASGRLVSNPYLAGLCKVCSSSTRNR